MASVYAFGDVELDESRFELRRGGAPVVVQRRVLDVLLYLVRERHRVATKDEIFAAVWPGVVVTESALSRAIMEARRALGPEGDGWIQTARGRGFRFVADVLERPALAAPTELALGGAAWRAIDDAIGAASRGRGAVIVVTGEAGAGKTSLLERASGAARRLGHQAVSSDLDDASRGAEGTGWQRVLEALGASTPGESTDALLARAPAAIEVAARRGPLVVTIDDAHRGSVASLSALRALTRLSPRAALVVVLALDLAHLGDARPEAAILREICHDAVMVRTLALGPSEIRELVAARTGRLLTDAELAALHAATGGNARLVAHLADAGLESARALRPGATLGSSAEGLTAFRRAALARAEKLAEPTRALLARAAVLGRDIVVARVAAVLGEEPRVVLAAMDECMAAELVRRRTSAVGAYRFAMGLVRDALYDSLPEAERARVHRAAAILPRDATTPDGLLDTARHWIRAGLLADVEARVQTVESAVRALTAAGRSDEAQALARDALAAEDDGALRTRLALLLSPARGGARA